MKLVPVIGIGLLAGLGAAGAALAAETAGAALAIGAPGCCNGVDRHPVLFEGVVRRRSAPALRGMSKPCA